MGKEYWSFAGESGETGFLAGAVDVLADMLSLHCVDFHTLNADVFYAPNQDIPQLTEAVKKRMYAYYDTEGLERAEQIEELDFSGLVRADCRPQADLTGCIPELRADKAAKKAEAEFLRALQWYLEKPVCIFSPASLPDKNVGILGPAYMSFAWNSFFIAYEEYMVLLIFGTSE